MFCDRFCFPRAFFPEYRIEITQKTIAIRKLTQFEERYYNDNKRADTTAEKSIRPVADASIWDGRHGAASPRQTSIAVMVIFR